MSSSHTRAISLDKYRGSRGRALPPAMGPWGLGYGGLGTPLTPPLIFITKIHSYSTHIHINVLISENSLSRKGLLIRLYIVRRVLLWSRVKRRLFLYASNNNINICIIGGRMKEEDIELKEDIGVMDTSELPTIEESLGHPLNTNPARSYKSELVFEDANGYLRFRDSNMLVLNRDGSARRKGGRPTLEEQAENSGNPSKYFRTRAQRQQRRKEKMLASKADIKQRDLLKRLDSAHFDVVNELIDIFEEEGTSKDQRIRILFKFADHAFPKLSVLNTNSESVEGFTFNINTAPSVDRKKEAIKKAMQ